MKKTFQILVKRSAASFLVGLLTLVTNASAGSVVGKITAIDYATGVIAIDGVEYKLFSPAATGVTDNQARAIELKSLRYGQVVTFSAKDGVITAIAVQPGRTEVPK